MAKTRKRHNWKARQSSASNTANSSQKSEETPDVEIQIQEDKYDSSNPFILPAGDKKQKKTKIAPKVEKKKVLSKKQKRRLEKVLEKKQRKINRSQLLEKLQSVQATPQELELMTSTSTMQTHGTKRPAPVSSSAKKIKVNTIKGWKRNRAFDSEEEEEDGDESEKKIKVDQDVGASDISTDDEEGSESDPASSEKSAAAASEITIAAPSIEKKQSSEQSIAVVKADLPKNGNEEEKVVSNDKAPTVEVEVSQEVKKSEPAIFVPVNRKPEIQAAREALPIYSEEQAIMEAIRENPVVVIHGATGSGKTTQVPQFLYEAGYTRNKRLIGITEPRRIAAIQMASRVGEEMNMPDAVSYQIRYEKTAADDKTEIKFMTDGVLLKEIRKDFYLSKYSVIIVDEAHERSVFSDVLIGLFSIILPLREKKGDPLKLIIMSATIRVEDFTENPRLFKQKKPFLITIDSRQYDVVIHFSTKTPVDYIEAAYQKVCKIHQQLPAGAILVFVTGEKEVTRLCKHLRKSFPYKGDTQKQNNEDKKGKDSVTKVIRNSVPKKRQKQETDFDSFAELPPKIDLDEYSVEPLDNEELQHEVSDGEDSHSDDEEYGFKSMNPSLCEPLYVLPLYSVLPTQEQAKIFKPPPPGCRLCVVATNVAETSVTIPGLKYVVDTGKVKTRVYDKTVSGVSTFAVTWTSKASSNQRAGRAGRTEGGHCYRLYSSSVFEHEFPSFTPPDIQRIPVDDILLQMKALGIDRVVNFPFPTPPDPESLKAAEKRLVKLGALQDLTKCQRFKDISKWEYSAKITKIGSAMSRFSLSPRFAKMLLLSLKYDVIPYTIAIVAAMSVPEVFLASKPMYDQKAQNEEEEEEVELWAGIKKIGAGQGKSVKLGDAMVLLRAVALYEQSKKQAKFCSKFQIRLKAMVEIHKMRLQLTREMNRTFKDLDLPMDLTLEIPSDDMIEGLRKVTSACLIDHVARKLTEDEIGKSKLQSKELRGAYKCLDLDELVYIHPGSIVSKQLPDYVVYQDIFQTSRHFMRTVMEMEPEWLAYFAPNQCIFSSPLEEPAPYYNTHTDKILCSMTSTFGPYNWEVPCVVMPFPDGLLKYTWFCVFLLEGQICPKLKAFTPFLLSKPNVMLKQWARLLPRTRSLLQAVVDCGVDSRKSLYEQWENNKSYLWKEYCEWLPQSKWLELEFKWPPIS